MDKGGWPHSNRLGGWATRSRQLRERSVSLVVNGKVEDAVVPAVGRVAGALTRSSDCQLRIEALKFTRHHNPIYAGEKQSRVPQPFAVFEGCGC